MFEFFTANEDNAISILKSDHNKVKDLFDQFENAENRREKKSIAAQAIKELKIHATIEEEIFYPSVRPKVEDDLMNEADEEHHVAKLLIAELEQMNASDDHFDAKFKVLAENIRHHIKEEEGKMFFEVRNSDLDFDAIGQEMLIRKKDLMENGIPASEEDKLMARTHGKVDSPAHAAKRHTAKQSGHYSSGTSAKKVKAAHTAKRKNA